MKHSTWLEELTTDSVRKTAKVAGVTHRTLAYQLEKESISPENVIAIAKAYGAHPVGALVDTEYLEPEWAQQVDPVQALRLVTEDQLADEVLRRMKLGVEPGGALSTPIDELETQRREQHKTAKKPHLREIKDETEQDALIERINAGVEPVAAQEATEPLEQDWT